MCPARVGRANETPSGRFILRELRRRNIRRRYCRINRIQALSGSAGEGTWSGIKVTTSSCPVAAPVDVDRGRIADRKSPRGFEGFEHPDGEHPLSQHDANCSGGAFERCGLPELPDRFLHFPDLHAMVCPDVAHDRDCATLQKSPGIPLVDP